MNSYQLIRYTIKEKSAVITLNRPEKMNALNAEMVSELKDAFNQANKNEDIRTVILKAEGGAFSAGADLSYLKDLQINSYEDNLKDSQHLMELFQIIYTHKKVIIAQVEGHAIAGGCGLATVCDFIFSIPEARFAYTEVKIGFVPAIVMTFLLRKTNESVVRRLMLTGDLIEAKEAFDLGIVYKICNKEAIDQEVESFVSKIATQTSSEAISITRRLITEVQHMNTNDALEYAAKVNAKARSTKDCQRGIAAFLNKEKIVWLKK